VSICQRFPPIPPIAPSIPQNRAKRQGNGACGAGLSRPDYQPTRKPTGDDDGQDAKEHRGPVGPGLGYDGARGPAVPAILPTLPGGPGRGAGRGAGRGLPENGGGNRENGALGCCKQGFFNFKMHGAFFESKNWFSKKQHFVDPGRVGEEIESENWVSGSIESFGMHQNDRDRPTREIHASRAALVPKPYRAVISRDTARRLIASRRIRSSSADRDDVIS
jgi:hypothetical protein